MSIPTPLSEPPWLDGHPSPYYNESHRRWQKFCRDFISREFTQYAMEWEEQGGVPAEVYKKFANNNMLIPNLPAPLPIEWLRSIGVDKIGPLPIEEFDYIHFSIYASEMQRSGLNGPGSSLTAGFCFGIPPILKFADRQLQQRVLPDLLKGNTRICIAITEPDAGSDVANVQTTAEKSQDGKHYIVNGTKKWITNGIWSDWASMCVRTGGEGPAGLSVLLVPLKGQKGVEMRKMHCSGHHCSGTTFIELDDVQVPVENLMGKEGEGMKYIMQNFNHERLNICISVTTQARMVLAAGFKYVMKRQAFGKPLIEQPVVRHRLAKAIAELETQWSWVESFVYQMVHLKKDIADEKIGGLTALAKAKSAMVLNECAQCAQLLFGGNGYTKGGQGDLVEKVSREVAGARIPGGSEDVMLDLAVRQLYKNYQRALKSSSRAERL